MRGIWLPISVAVVLRVVYWLQVRDEAWFIAPGTDPAFYLTWAKTILAGEGARYVPFPRAPLYPYILAGMIKLFGTHWIFPRLLNLAADLATVAVLHRLGRRLGGEGTARTAALLFAVTGSAVYFTGEILMTSLATALASVLLLILTDLWLNPRPAPAAWGGILIGVTALLRPNILSLLPFTVIALVVLLRKRGAGLRKTLTTTAVHIVCALAVLAPVTAANWNAARELIPVSLQGGVNFYIGNARGASGWASWLPGAGAAWNEFDAEHIAEADAGRSLAPHEVSTVLWRKGMQEIEAAPGAWAALTVKKALLLLGVREIGNNRPLTLARESSPLIRLLFLISLGLMLPLALVGLGASFRRHEVQAVLFYLLTFGGTLLTFFVNSRYRMPLVPAVCLLAALGIVRLLGAVRAKAFPLRAAALLAIGLAVALPNWSGETFELPVQAQYVAGNALLRLGRAREAINKYRRALELDPHFPELHLNYGAALMAVGDTTSAELQFRCELNNNPHSAKALNNLGVIAEGRGRIDEAQGFYQRAVETDPWLEDARINLCRFFIHQTKSSPNDPRPWLGLAVVAGLVYRWDDARRMLTEALQRDPNYAPARQLLKAIEGKE